MKLAATFTFMVALAGAFAQTQSFGKDVYIELPKGKDNFEYFVIADSSLSDYSLPKNFAKPEQWKKSDERRGNKNGYIGYTNSYSDTFDFEDAIAILETEKEFSKVCSAKSWCIDHYSTAFPYLVSKLSDKRKIGLTNSADLIIGDRITSGDMKFYGHGGAISEDLFTIAGRASWILNELTGEEFAIVSGNLTKEQAQRMKALWKDYIAGLAR